MDGASTAVMVWTHGGGYILGSGDRTVYGPDFLVDEQVVVVTFNYRLGVLGKYIYLCFKACNRSRLVTIFVTPEHRLRTSH
jgi:carboxylesterase type B